MNVTPLQVRLRRLQARNLDNLTRLSILSFVKNVTFYIGKATNPCTSLSAPLVLKILKLINEERKYFQRLIPSRDLQIQLFCLLLHPGVTRFDSLSPFYLTSDPKIYNHVLANCPNISYISYAPLERERTCPVNQICKWENLRYLDIRCRITLEELKIISSHVPNLEALGFLPQDFTMEGVEWLAKFESLEYLGLFSTADVNILVHSAGKVPNLKRFEFSHEMDTSERFIEDYGKNYAEKSLTVKNISLYKFQDWPACLKAEQVELNISKVSNKVIENLNAINSARLQVVCRGSMCSSEIHALVETLGSKIESLDLSIGEVRNQLNVYKIVSCCPKLERLWLCSDSAPFASTPTYGVCPDSFKNWKIIKYETDDSKINPSDEEIINIMKLFFMGSEEVDRVLWLDTLVEIKAAAQALHDNPTCLNQTEKVYIRFNPNDCSAMQASKVCTALAYSAPVFSKIIVCASELDIRDEYVFRCNYHEF